MTQPEQQSANDFVDALSEDQRTALIAVRGEAIARSPGDSYIQIYETA